MPIIKPSWDGKADTGGRYDGPPVKPGTYVGQVAGVWLTEIKNGDNAGEDQLVVSCEITSGTFKGARILTNIQVLKSTGFKINQWLKAMTDGSERQIDALLKYFWDIGYRTDDNEENEVKNLGIPVLSIGKKFNPVGRPIRFIVKMDGGYQDNPPKPIIDRFVVPLENSDDDDDDDDGISDDSPEEAEEKPKPTAKKATKKPEPEPDPEDEDDDEDTSPPSEDGDDDDDDPWG